MTIALPQPEDTRPLDELIAEVEGQEAALVLPVPFTQEDAWALAQAAASVIIESGLRMAADVRIGGHLVSRVKLAESEQGTDGWLARKSATTLLLDESSLLIRYRHMQAGTSFAERGLDDALYVAEGGAFPLRTPEGIVGTITMSGQEGYVDHALAVAALARHLGK